jgi:NAD+ diphosphatase
MLRAHPQFIAQNALKPRDGEVIKTLCFRANELLVVDDMSSFFSLPDFAVDSKKAVAIGELHGEHYQAIHVSPDFEPLPQTKFINLRAAMGVMPNELIAIAGRASQLVRWDQTHQFCGVCATPTQREAHERSRKCPACGHTAYPRISPAMMCLVTRENTILLARNVSFPQGRFSALAGFLEVGESIEDAVHREVFEEVGIKVHNLQYFDSQAWPFPDSLMIAFTAEYLSGELQPNGIEIAEADWFDLNRLPQLPPRLSISRALIDGTLAKLNKAN